MESIFLSRKQWLFIALMSGLMLGGQVILRMISGEWGSDPVAALRGSVGYTFLHGLGWTFVVKALDWMYAREKPEGKE